MKSKIEVKKPEARFELTKETVKDLAVKTNVQAGLRKTCSMGTSDSANACCA